MTGPWALATPDPGGTSPTPTTASMSSSKETRQYTWTNAGFIIGPLLVDPLPGRIDTDVYGEDLIGTSRHIPNMKWQGDRSKRQCLRDWQEVLSWGDPMGT